MGLFSTDPAEQHEKMIHKESKSEEKQLKNLIKEVGKAEKEQDKASKAQTSAHHDYEKAHKVEMKEAEKLNEATGKHNSAVTKEQAALHEAKAKEEHHQRAQAILAEKKAALDNLQHNHQTNESIRGQKLNELKGSPSPPRQNAALQEGALDRHYADQGYGGLPPREVSRDEGFVNAPPQSEPYGAAPMQNNAGVGAGSSEPQRVVIEHVHRAA